MSARIVIVVVAALFLAASAPASGIGALLVPAALDAPDSPEARRALAVLDELEALRAAGPRPLKAYAFSRSLMGLPATPEDVAPVDPRAYVRALAPNADPSALALLTPDAYDALGALLGAHAAAASAVARDASVGELEALRATVIERSARVLDLRDSYRVGGPVVDECGAVFIDFGDAGRVHACDYAVAVYGFGDDEYRNRAGGSAESEAALAIDLGGDDRYLGAYTTSGGINGGAHGGLRGPGFGALVDFAGDDEYAATFVETLRPNGDPFWPTGGINGGAGRSAVGLLLEAAGNDSYDGWVGNGGVNGGASFGGSGAFLDLGGRDESFHGHVASLSGGVNGGANDGSGLFFHCGSGRNSYTGYVEQRGGVNSGGEQANAVFVGCGGESTTYDGRAGGGGVNGGGTGEGHTVFVHLEGAALLKGHVIYGGVNGGVHIGSTENYIGPGDQVYWATSEDFGGLNSGGSIGASVLVDVSGNDYYYARSPGSTGANGGGFFGGHGTLIDLAGDDVYDAHVGREPQREFLFGDVQFAGGGTNGWGEQGGCGVLLDFGGRDRYRDAATEPWHEDESRVAGAPACGARIDA